MPSRHLHAALEPLVEGFALLEGPVWQPGQGLLFADVERGGVYRLDRRGGTRVVVPHRRGIGGLALHAGGGIVVSGRNVAWKLESGRTRVLFEAPAGWGATGFNDLAADPQGRILAGALRFRPREGYESARPGALWRLGLDGAAEVLVDDVLLANGIAFSPDGTWLYHADSVRRELRRYRYGPSTPLAGEVLATFDDGIPDGVAVSADGRIWVAVCHGARVEVLRASGARVAVLRAPVPMVTSVCFGGDENRDLYVVTGSDGTGRDDAGSIHRARVDVPGAPVYPARVSLD